MKHEFRRWSNYHGRISAQLSDIAGHAANSALTESGYTVRVLWNGKELHNCLMADSNSGIAVVGHVNGFGVTPETKRGNIEIQISKKAIK